MGKKQAKELEPTVLRIALFETCKKLGAVKATVEYNGSGDDGSCEPGELWGKDNEPLEVPKGLTVTWANERHSSEQMSIPQALQAYCYEVLEHHFPGDWINNEGGYGMLKITLEHPYKVILEAHQRVEATDDYVIDVETGRIISETSSRD